MRSNRRKISRRAFLAAPAVVAVAEATRPQSARAFAPSFSHAANNDKIAKAAILSVRNCASDGFVSVPSWLPRPFEADLLRNDPALMRELSLRAADIVARGVFDPDDFSEPQLVTLPKNTHDARRICALVEPLDTAVYLTLAVLTAPLIEQHKISPSSNVVHSYRFLPGRSRLFEKRFSIISFLTAAERQAPPDGLVIKCDLANCYGSITSERMAAMLERCGVPAWQVEFIGGLLRFWQHPDSPGLPIGSNASRILSEAVLLQVDRRLREANVPYIRFVDDFRIFASDDSAARLALEALTDAAASQGLSLNADKTEFVRVANATTDQAATAERSQESPRRKRYRLFLAATASGYAALPKFFAHASAEEIRLLRRVRNAMDAASFLHGEIAPLPTLGRAFRWAVYAGSSEFLRAMPRVLTRYPEFAAYAASGLIWESKFVPADVRDHLRTEFAAMLLDQATPDFVAVKLIDVLSHSAYRDRETLVRFATERARQPRGIAVRAALDALRESGGIVPAVASRFEEMDGWCKRAVLADRTCRHSITYSDGDLDLIGASLAS